MLNASQSQPLDDTSLQPEDDYRSRLQEIGNKINAARDLDEILIDLKDEITALFSAERH